jgi:redox-sensitive bicupin YhaK (pirin superfamily)
MLLSRNSEQRGQADHGWLKTKHTFSFANYYDPTQLGFRSLRVINEDFIAPNNGFGTHPHDEMEIITYMLEGTITHRDSIGNEKTLSAGEVQAMTAGTGITHSEFNRDKEKPIHLLQIWLKPKKSGVKPDYAEKHFSPEQKQNKLKLIVSADGRDDSLRINQDASLFASLLQDGKELQYELPQGRHAWLQLIEGEVTLNGSLLDSGDGLAISNETLLRISAFKDSHFLLFDLA